MVFALGCAVRVAWLCAALGCGVISCRGEEPEPRRRPVEKNVHSNRARPPSQSPASAEEGSPGHSWPKALPPRVDLSGADAALSHAVIDDGPRIYATHLRTWVFERPDRDSKRLGYLRAGSSAAASEKAFGQRGCRGGWRAIEPRGFVCVGKRASLDRSHPLVELFEPHPPRTDQRLPYRYGTVRRPGPVYGRLPEGSELLASEPDFPERFPLWIDIGGEIGATFRPEVWSWGRPAPSAKSAYAERLDDGVPDFLGQRKWLPSPLGRPRPTTSVLDRMEARVGYSFLHTFFSQGRRYGLSTHLELAPLDRFRPIVGSDFHGVEIGKDVSLPFLFVRRLDARFRDGTKAPYREVLSVSGKRKFFDGQLHYETEDGRYISDRYASEVRAARKMPGWAKRGEKWISVSIAKQVLVAYEGTVPVFATLVSTGEAGLDDAETTTATKRGWFRIHTKHVTSTMASDESGEEFELRDVPYVQYFAEGGYALHGAYWHDRFGIPKSHGCINLAPEDAKRLFHWTEPQVPLGWHGTLSPLRGTIVFVHP